MVADKLIPRFARLVAFLRFLPLGDPFFPLCNRGLVVIAFRERVPFFQKLSVLPIVLHDISSYPCFGSRATPGVVDQPNWNIQRLMKLTPEEITDC